jgi:hypothetical protein
MRMQLTSFTLWLRRQTVLPVEDKFVRMIVDFGDACMTTQMGKLKEGVFKFEKILQSNREELRDPENRYLYEDVQQRRGFALTSLERYGEAASVLKEAASFRSVRPLHPRTCRRSISILASATPR